MLKTLIILSVVVLAVTSVGWKKFIYFISIGYGYSVAAIAISLFFIYHNISWWNIVMAVLMILYGFRLATYLLVRELKSASYVKTVSLDAMKNSDYSPMVLFFIWISCVLLYICQMFPLTLRMDVESHGVTPAPLMAYIGIGLTAVGILLEALADWQKNVAKKKNPGRFVDTGLYRMVRCPNYFGEVIVWTGVFVSGIGCYTEFWHWLLALLGYVGIVYIMFSGARRIEIRQDKNYGDDLVYQAYKRKTPILIPLLPIYSVKRFKWLKG